MKDLIDSKLLVTKQMTKLDSRNVKPHYVFNEHASFKKEGFNDQRAKVLRYLISEKEWDLFYGNIISSISWFGIVLIRLNVSDMNLENLPLIIKEQKLFIFIHVIKTAGTGISRALGLRKKYHSAALESESLIEQDQWIKAFKFSFVRNPWDKVVSQYKYRIQPNETKMGGHYISFKDWVKDPKYCNNPKMFSTQACWLQNSDNLIGMDFIGRFENLLDDFCRVAEEIGVPTHLPHCNSTPSTGYKDFYISSSKGMVAEWFKEDIDLFHYQF